MILCKNCGAEIDDGCKFCTRCGAPVERPADMPRPDSNTDFQGAPAPRVRTYNAVPADSVRSYNGMPLKNAGSGQNFQNAGNPQNPGNAGNPQNAGNAGNPQAYGTPQGASFAAQGAGPEPPKEKKPLNKKVVIIIVVAVLVFVGLMVGGILIMNGIRHKQMNRHRTVNVNEYVMVDFSGYDGEGQAVVRLDYNDFYDAVLEAVSKNYSGGGNSYRYSVRARNLCSSVILEVSPDMGLSNGDKVTVTMEYSEEAAEEAGIDLVFESCEVRAEGLKNSRAVDIFEYLKITYDGMDGSVWVTCENTATEKGLRDVYFKVDGSNNYNLSVGDSFTVTVDNSYVKYLLDNYGIALESTSKTYTVGRDDVDRYIDTVSEISDELLETMDEYAVNEIEDQYLWMWESELSDVEYMGMYLLNPNEENGYEGNYLFMIYTGTVSYSDDEKDRIKVFMPVEVDNLVRKADGSQECSSYVSLWDDGNYAETGESEYKGYLSEKDMFLDILNEENLMSFVYEISDGMRDYYDNPDDPVYPTEEETSEDWTENGETGADTETEDETTADGANEDAAGNGTESGTEDGEAAPDDKQAA